MLKQRLITAVILLAIVLSVLFFLPPAAFCLLMGVIALGAAWEWTNLMEVKSIAGRLLYLSIMLLLLYNALFVPLAIILVIAVTWWLCAVPLVFLYPARGRWLYKSMVVRGVMGALVLLPCWAAVSDIRNQINGLYLLLFLFVIVWGADTAAYFVGRKWGATKLAPQVSPGKSVQGVLGAFVFVALGALLMLWVGHVMPQQWLPVLGLALLTAAFSVLGDLFESLLKRQVGLKDSGRLLPGHGGLLDRIDSLTAAAPIFAFGTFLLRMYL